MKHSNIMNSERRKPKEDQQEIPKPQQKPKPKLNYLEVLLLQL